jgi:hypothetical protein
MCWFNAVDTAQGCADQRAGLGYRPCDLSPKGRCDLLRGCWLALLVSLMLCARCTTQEADCTLSRNGIVVARAWGVLVNQGMRNGRPCIAIEHDGVAVAVTCGYYVRGDCE